MIKLDGKKVRFIATDRKYRTEPYPAIAPLDSKLNTYITGQHIDHNDDDTKGNLTLAEITGEKEVKPESRLKLFPFIINDVDPVLIIHNKEYDCTVDSKRKPNNPKDYAEAHFILLQKGLVAKNKSEVRPRHKFHLEDKDADAVAFVNKSDSVYEAEKLIREKASIEDYKDLVMMLNLTIPGFNVNHKTLTDTRLKEVLLKQANTDPASILKAFTKEGENILFIAQLVEENIITHKVGNGYYDGQKFIANDINSFLGFINDTANSSLIGKFGKLLIDSKEAK
jgi:hypothetical protein